MKELIEKIKNEDADVNDYDNFDEIKIDVYSNDRHIFHKIILPNLPKGYQISALHPVGNGKNKFKIYKIKND